MKIKNLLKFGIISLVVVMASCDKKEDDGLVENPKFNNPVTEGDTVFVGLSSEESKAVVEDEALEMLDEMQAMEEAMPVEVSEAMVHFLDADFPFEDVGGYKSQDLRQDYIFAPTFAMANYDGNINSLFKAITITGAESEPENLVEVYDEFVGIYTWADDEWEYEETGDEIKFLFPSTENGTTNDASFVIALDIYTGEVLDPILENNLPTSAKAELSVGSNVEAGYYIDVEYDAEGLPTKIETKLEMGDYRMKLIAEGGTQKNFDLSYFFAHNNDVLVGFTFGMEGDWTEDNINDNIEIAFYGEWYDESTGEWYYEEIDVEDIPEYDGYVYVDDITKYDIHKVITNGNVSLQMMNLKLAGSIDFEGLGEELIPLIEDFDYDYDDEDEFIEEIIAVGNKYIGLSLRRAEDNEILAMVEAYPKLYEDTYEEYYYDGEWHDTPIVVTESWYDLGFRFVFADGSLVDMETYMGEGFDEIVNSMEDWGDELDDTYGK